MKHLSDIDITGHEPTIKAALNLVSKGPLADSDTLPFFTVKHTVSCIKLILAEGGLLPDAKTKLEAALKQLEA